MTGKKEKSGQYALPLSRQAKDHEGYDIYPSFRLGEGQISHGLEALADLLSSYTVVVIDGYSGVYYDIIRDRLDKKLKASGLRIGWTDASSFLKPEEEIMELTDRFTGGNDPLFGTRCNMNLNDFFRRDELIAVRPDHDCDINIIIGTGASLAGWQGLMVYVDLPKNEQQYRARSGKIVNLGMSAKDDPKVMYKRSYFVDWPVLNQYKQLIFRQIDIYVDGQRPDDPVWIKGEDLRAGLSAMSRNLFRARPWFEPGPWGGTWIKEHINGLNNHVPNYAWSFELITPENGLLFESSSLLLEVSFDTIMYLEAEAVLGECHNRFGTEFPIRFDFLDTFDGGNLSIQCHPRPEYTQKHFGENFTQEETYYILDTKDDAAVYLGFQDNISPDEFRNELKRSEETRQPLDVERFVQTLPASKHDLFLIPYGTVHGSGKNNMVLEISSTPYIFTFKMYDWLRKDLNGKQRDLNIERAMDNLFFDRKGEYVSEMLKSKPLLLNKGNDWQLWHLPTHETHFYDVHRYSFRSSVKIQTDNRCLVMSLVEGKSIMVETVNGVSQRFSYAETFILPAASVSVTVTNLSEGEAMLVMAFVKKTDIS